MFKQEEDYVRLRECKEKIQSLEEELKNSNIRIKNWLDYRDANEKTVVEELEQCKQKIKKMEENSETLLLQIVELTNEVDAIKKQKQEIEQYYMHHTK